MSQEVQRIFAVNIYRQSETLRLSNKGREKGPNQVLHKEALPQGPNLFPFVWCFFQERLLFHIHVASSLKPLSHTYGRPITSIFVDKLAMNV